MKTYKIAADVLMALTFILSGVSYYIAGMQSNMIMLLIGLIFHFFSMRFYMYANVINELIQLGYKKKELDKNEP